MKFLKSVPRPVFLLGFVSLFTDASTEMIFPILPLFLTQVLGAGPMAIGVIEGVAETTAATLKVFSGIWADRLRKRKPLVILGYSLSSFFRPFIGFATIWPVAFERLNGAPYSRRRIHGRRIAGRTWSGTDDPSAQGPLP